MEIKKSLIYLVGILILIGFIIINQVFSEGRDYEIVILLQSIFTLILGVIISLFAYHKFERGKKTEYFFIGEKIKKQDPVEKTESPKKIKNNSGQYYGNSWNEVGNLEKVSQ